MKIFFGGRYITNKTLPPDAYLLYLKLKSLGFEFSDIGQDSILLQLDHDEKNFRRYLDTGGSKSRAYLVRLETDSVLPSQYSEEVSSKYRHIFSLGSIPEAFGRGEYLGHPLTYRPFTQNDESNNPNIPIIDLVKNNKVSGLLSLSHWHDRDLDFVAICSNKIGLSKNNNYKFRALFLRSITDFDFHLFGPLWNGFSWILLENRLRTLLWGFRSHQLENIKNIFQGLFWSYPRNEGAVPNKYEVLSRTKFYFIFENSDLFVTEKIFEAYLFGAVPVYFGSKLELFGLNPNTCIQFNAVHNTQQILEELREFPATEILKIKESIECFLSSNEFINQWTAEGVFSSIAKRIMMDLEIRG
jgi:hypothetical protein